MIDAPSSPPISPAPPSIPGLGGPPPPEGSEGGESNQLSLDPNLRSKAESDGGKCQPGDTYTVQLTVRANDQGDFDVVDTEPFQKIDSATGPADDPSVLSSADEERVLGYSRPKKSMAGPKTY